MEVDESGDHNLLRVRAGRQEPLGEILFFDDDDV
jgi:hypothetical protein